MNIKMSRVALYTVFSTLLVVSLTAILRSIPGPPYGGDLYSHNGISRAIFYGTPVFRDPTNYDGFAFYHGCITS